MSEVSFTQLVVLRADGIEDRWGGRTKKQTVRLRPDADPQQLWTGLSGPTLVPPRDDLEFHYSVEASGALRVYSRTSTSETVWGHYAPGAWVLVRQSNPTGVRLA